MTTTPRRCADLLSQVLLWPFPMNGPAGPGCVVSTPRRCDPASPAHLKDYSTMITNPRDFHRAIPSQHRHFLATAQTEAVAIGKLAREGMGLLQFMGGCLAAMALGATLVQNLGPRQQASS